MTWNNIEIMKLNETLEGAFAEQITLELASSIVYLQLAIALDEADLPGMASWMRIQADEERTHAAKFITHAADRGNSPQIGLIEAPVLKENSVRAVFEASLENEQRVSNSIRALYRLAQAEGDIDSMPLLYWFIQEQIEEEATVSGILGRLHMIGDDGAGLLRLDAELGARAATPAQ